MSPLPSRLQSSQARLLVCLDFGPIGGRNIYGESFTRVHRWVVPVARDPIGDDLVIVAFV